MSADKAPAPQTRAAEARALMAALALGDRAALARLIARFGPGLTRFARQVLTRPDDAEDVVQECFLRAWHAAASYDPARGAVSSWLYRIALRLCLDRNRRAAVRRFLGFETGPQTEAGDDSPGAETALGARQELARTAAAIRRLPERQRQALLMRATAEMTTAEIAAAMGIGTGAAEQLLVRARAALRIRLSETEPGREG
jgi:RNA polymerase sigma-70 factor (ECF subfamily)